MTMKTISSYNRVGLAMFVIAMLVSSCSGTTSLPALSTVDASKSRLSAQAATPITCTAEPHIAKVFTPSQNFPAETSGSLSATTIAHLSKSNYFLGTLSALGVSRDVGSWVSTSKQVAQPDGSVDVMVGINKATNFVIYFHMASPMVGTMTQEMVYCGAPSEIINSYSVNNISQRVAQVKTISFQSITSGTLITVGNIDSNISGVMSGQSVSAAAASSSENAFIVAPDDSIVGYYTQNGINYLSIAARNTSLSAQTILVNPVTSPVCQGGASSAGTISGQSIVACPATTNPDIQSEDLAATNKPNADKCYSEYKDYQAAVKSQRGKGTLTFLGGVGTVISGAAGVFASAETAGAAGPPSYNVTYGLFTGTTVAYFEWRAAQDTTAARRNDWEKCKQEKGVD